MSSESRLDFRRKLELDPLRNGKEHGKTEGETGTGRGIKKKKKK
jgi:hypothetical protein